MQRLSGLDAGFLYMETPAHPMHTLKLIVLDPAVPGGAGLHETLHAGLTARLHLLPPFRRRVLEVPFGLHHPLWIEDPSFELAAHLRRATVPSPGTRAHVDAVVAEIASAPLDRTRPLWEMWTLEGLEGGRAAVLVKIHHAVADGLAIARLLANVMTTEPDGDVPRADGAAWTPDRVPSPWELLAGATVDHLRQAARLPGLLQTTTERIGALYANRRASSIATPRPVLDTPRTSFNGALTGLRSFATTSLSLDDANAVKHAFGVTLNDVVLGLVSGALRRYLEARGELPSRSLVASVPVSSERRDDPPRLDGNRVSSLFATLATHVADPVERLRTIHAVSAEAKHVQSALGTDLMGQWAAYTPPPLLPWVLRQWAALRMADRFPAAINVIVSNVPGPSSPLFVPGHRLHAIYSVGPVLEGIGLNITTWSYQGELHVGALACRDMVPDPSLITDGMGVALDELTLRARDGRDRSATHARS